MTTSNEPQERPANTTKRPSNDEFDADYGPNNPHNQDVAKRRGLTYNPHSRRYEDNDGCLIRDRFGQPL